MIEIQKLSSLSKSSAEYEDIIQQIRTIFFLSSSIKEFSSDERREAFFKKWCGDFIRLYPENFYLMQEEKKLLGYLSGCLDSEAARSVLEVPGYDVFMDLFSDFPAHLHINFHPDCRGRGLGSHLVLAFISDLEFLKIKGVHLVTSPDAKNVTFYQRLGFTHEVVRPFHGSSLLFMGRNT